MAHWYDKTGKPVLLADYASTTRLDDGSSRHDGAGYAGLLNNLDIRLQRFGTLVGRRSALWHGDVKTTHRWCILTEPPDCQAD